MPLHDKDRPLDPPDDNRHSLQPPDDSRHSLQPPDKNRHSLQPPDKNRHSLQPADKARLYFFLGLLASAILYSIFFLFLLNTASYETMPRTTRHAYKFGSLILAWLIGFIIYRKIAPAWLLQLWNVTFAIVLTLLLALAAYDAFIHTFPLSLRDTISTFHQALISPIPYVILGLLNFAVNRPPSTKNPD
jgi:hypothetical protein